MIPIVRFTAGFGRKIHGFKRQCSRRFVMLNRIPAMPLLSGQLGWWTVPLLHQWKDIKNILIFVTEPMIKPDSKITAIGSYFAAKLATAMKRLNLAEPCTRQGSSITPSRSSKNSRGFSKLKMLRSVLTPREYGTRILNMPVLSGKLGQWILPYVHMWKDRKKNLIFTPAPVIGPTTKIATIGSCFAAELATAMTRLNLDGAMHPAGLFYNTKSIRQEFERIFEDGTAAHELGVWETKDGFIHPLKSYRKAQATEAELIDWSEAVDEQASTLFSSAEVVVITLGLIEAWKTPSTDIYLPQIPHPEIFPDYGARFCRLTVQDMIEDLEVIRGLIKKHTKAELVLTVSPIPLHSTFTDKDVRVANSESKGRIRAAVSQFTETHSDVHYFHSYEMVTTAERLSDFMLEDGRHVHRKAVDHILQQFLLQYAQESLHPVVQDPAWLTAPAKISARPKTASSSQRIIKKARTFIPGPIEEKLVQITRELKRVVR
jgi:hypothetical protein